MPPLPPDRPPIRRVAIDDHLADATADIQDPERRAAIVAEARHLEPLRKVQVAFDQMVRTVEDDLHDALVRRDTVELSARARDYIDAEFEVVKRHLAVLDAAAEAAHEMVDVMGRNIIEYAGATSRARADAVAREEARAEEEAKAKGRPKARAEATPKADTPPEPTPAPEASADEILRRAKKGT